MVTATNLCGGPGHPASRLSAHCNVAMNTLLSTVAAAVGTADAAAVLDAAAAGTADAAAALGAPVILDVVVAVVDASASVESVATLNSAAVALGVAAGVVDVAFAAALVESLVAAESVEIAATVAALVFVGTVATVVELAPFDVVDDDALFDERTGRGLAEPTVRWLIVELEVLAESFVEFGFDPESAGPPSVAAEATPCPAPTARPRPTAAARIPLRAACVALLVAPFV